MADLDPLAAALARAFEDDPVFDFCFPERNRDKSFKQFFEHDLRSTHLARDETWTTVEGIHGGALWAPPGQWRQSLWGLARNFPAYARILGRKLPRALRALTAVENAHPPGDHYYLAVLGTEPAAQGKGVGSAMLAPVLERCDREGIGAYLESSKEANVAFYNRHGFEVTRELPMPGGGPSVWLMWREPKPDRA
ncbi:MAG: hypothetical protein QOF21_945 [Actinomycetota bacterium]|jgi:ribosomal protein S18 acetylase RimI-like enzyme